MDRFQIIYSGWDPEQQKLREALCTLGNGYFCTRGAAEESKYDSYNYPGTYLAGGYNRAKSYVSGKEIENEDLVNFPNWLYLNFRPEGGDWLSLAECIVHQYEQRLEMNTGTLNRSFVVEDKQGRRTKIESRRFVSMRDVHNAALEWTLTPQNWGGAIEIVSELDGNIINNGVDRYKDLEGEHLEPVSSESVEEGILLTVQTRQSNLVMAQGCRTVVFQGDEQLSPEKNTEKGRSSIAQHFFIQAKEGHSLRVEKIVALYTSRDKSISEPSLDAHENISVATGFDELLQRHIAVWSILWHYADIKIDNGVKTQQLLRLHIFHILQTASPNSIGLDVGIPARGWHGEAYRGHIFWDELFITPFFNIRLPEITRNVLMYRFHRLEKAREAAAREGLKGAMYPWQSGSNGREESQRVHLNPESGNWLPDHTYLQHHVNSAIAYNIWNYFKSTDDHQFLSYYGAEMFLSIALFWSSKAIFDNEKQRYVLLKVVGPDEYHTSYPDSDQQGLNNNAYTNILAAWVLQKAMMLLSILEKDTKETLLRRLKITPEELGRWKEIGSQLFIPFLDGDVISQFEGYEDLEELSWDKYKDVHRLDRELEKEGDSINRYKASKQADVLMLFYLFSEDEVQEIFETLGYTFSKEMIRKNIDYYMERTSHGSTLSRLVFSWILAQYDEKESWKNFEKLLISDFEDIQGGTTPEGIHLGAMAGSLDLLQQCFCGVDVRQDSLWIVPRMLHPIRKIEFKIRYKGHLLLVSFDHGTLTVNFQEGWSNSIKVGVIDQLYSFEKNETKTFSLK